MRRSLLAIPLALSAVFASSDALAAKSLGDFRYFRALSIDLQGRMPLHSLVASASPDVISLMLQAGASSVNG